MPQNSERLWFGSAARLGEDLWGTQCSTYSIAAPGCTRIGAGRHPWFETAGQCSVPEMTTRAPPLSASTLRGFLFESALPASCEKVKDCGTTTGQVGRLRDGFIQTVELVARYSSKSGNSRV